MKRKVVFKVDMKDQKSRDKALKIAVELPGTESAAIQGDDKSLLEVTGDEIDPVQLARLLREEVGHVNILSVSPVVDKEKQVHQHEHTSSSVKSEFSHFEEEDILEVDAKADDFISKFKQQLDLQRIDSIPRYKDHQSEEKQVHQQEHTSWWQKAREIRRRVINFSDNHSSLLELDKQVGQYEDTSASNSSPCIQKKPELVSIGPYHMDKELPLNKYKYSMLQNFLSWNQGKDLCFYVQQMVKLESRTRRCYSKVFSMGSSEFVEMLLVDGCFLMEVLNHFGRSEKSENGYFPIEPWQIPILLRDLLMLENQIPFVVLEKLFDLSESEEATTTVSLLSMALKFIDLAFPLSMDFNSIISHLEAPQHLLHLLLRTIRPSNPPKPSTSKAVDEADEVKVYLESSARELQKSGIEFRPRRAGRFMDIHFKNGVLEIPPLTINDLFIAILDNGMAFEQCSTGCSKDITAYVCFMSSLIRHPTDVELLCSDGIISRFSHDNERVVSSFAYLKSKISDIGIPQDSYLYMAVMETKRYNMGDIIPMLRNSLLDGVGIIFSYVVILLIFFFMLIKKEGKQAMLEESMSTTSVPSIFCWFTPAYFFVFLILTIYNTIFLNFCLSLTCKLARSSVLLRLISFNPSPYRFQETVSTVFQKKKEPVSTSVTAYERIPDVDDAYLQDQRQQQPYLYRFSPVLRRLYSYLSPEPTTMHKNQEIHTHYTPEQAPKEEEEERQEQESKEEQESTLDDIYSQLKDGHVSRTKSDTKPVDQYEDTSSSDSTPCIQKKPELVSIGPYHIDKELPLNKYKYSFLERFLSRNQGRDLCFYVQQMMTLESRTRRCYSKVFSVSSSEFVEMMLVDGCFLMEVLNHFGMSEESENGFFPIEPWQIPVLVRDLLMLENQIPFFVLEKLFDLSKSEEATTTTVSLLSMALKFIDLAFPLSMDFNCIINHLEAAPQHLLHLLLQTIRPSNPPKPSILKAVDEVKVYLESTARELQKSGIEFRPKRADRFMDIHFKNGVLEIPPVTINDLFIAILVNGIAFEQCSTGCSKDITAYVCFMSRLIRHPIDVELLCSDGIISRFSHENEQVVSSLADLQSKISDLGIPQESYLYMTVMETKRYYMEDRIPSFGNSVLDRLGIIFSVVVMFSLFFLSLSKKQRKQAMLEESMSTTTVPSIFSWTDFFVFLNLTMGTICFASSLASNKLSPYRFHEEPVRTTITAYERIPDVDDAHLQDQRQEGEETPKLVRASSVSKRKLSPYRSQEPVTTTVTAFERIPDVGDAYLQDQRQEQHYLFITPPQLQQQQPPADNDSLKLCRSDMDSDKEIEGNDQVTGHIISTTIGGKNGEPKQTISYMAERVVGTGAFAVVFRAKCLETGETVAIKKVLQDRRYKNRELQLMRLMDHPNVVSLKHCFFSTSGKDELFLNLVMEYVPETVYRVLKHYNRMKQRMPLIYVKLYAYQTFRGLAYIHAVPGVCHRDVKPQNLLVDPLTHQVKLCDFGSAKVLVKGEANISYICSRYYRAPELILGATEYTTSIDIWSSGCVLAELFLGQPLFPGESAVDQLVEIIKVLGTPSREEILCMNPNYTDFRFPQIKAHPWHKVFHRRMPLEAIDLASRLLQYSPSLRCNALEALAHPFFDELREPNARLPNGRPLPPLFNFKQELAGASPELINRLIPEHVRRQKGHGFPHPAGT